MKADDFRSLLRAARDPWSFLIEHVRTQDPARGVLGYPDYHYLRELVNAAHQHRFVLVPKSRQMMVTWTMVAYVVWRALFRGPALFLFLSRNERCAEELLERARFILDQLPPFMQPRRTTNSREEIAFGNVGSRILSLPASPHGPRMYSPSGVFWDEMAFTPYDEMIWTALKPALDSGGSFWGVSSSGGANNLFARFILAHSGSDPAIHPSSLILHPLFHIHRIHYSQHPDRDENWKQQAALGLSLTRWQQEQEISFDAVCDLVYDEFDPQQHILASEWMVNPADEIYRSIDFGYHHPFVLWFQRLPDGQLIIFDEWGAENNTTEQMLTAIRHLDLAHGITESEVNWTACDPAGAQVSDVGISPVDFLRRNGIKLRYRPSRIAPGIELVKAALRDATGRVSVRISPRCRLLIGDFLRYKWNVQKDEPAKDGLCDHSMDALRYFFVNLESRYDDHVFSPRLAGSERR